MDSSSTMVLITVSYMMSIATLSLGAALPTATAGTDVLPATTSPDLAATTVDTGRYFSHGPFSVSSSPHISTPPDATAGLFTSSGIPEEGSESSQPDGAAASTPTESSVFVWSPIAWSWVVILQLISGIVGIVGNFLVIVVLFQRRGKSRSMDTLILGLALADFLTSVCIVPIPHPSFLPNNVIGQLYCRLIVTNSVMWWSITISTYILMSISVERYLAIVYPFIFKRFVTRRRVIIAIAVIVLLSTMSGIYGPFVHAVDENTNTCVERYISTRARLLIACYWFCLRLVIPCLTMLVTQVLIARELNHQFINFKSIANNPTPNVKEQGTTFHLVARKRVIKMMVVVIITYIICWTPNQLAFLGYNFGWVPVSYLLSPMHYVFTVLAFYNSCANPIIYAARFPEFRQGLKDAFLCAKPKNVPLFETKG